MQVDMDSFDPIYYHFGMETYGNMPLIEPLETKEMKKIEDFVIVIDTSMSCKEPDPQVPGGNLQCTFRVGEFFPVNTGSYHPV